MPNDNKKKLIVKLRKPFRLLIVNENNFEERASFRLTPINVLLLFSLLFLLFFILSFVILRTSQVGSYIGTSSKGNEKAELVEIKNKLDLIEQKNKRETRRRKDIIKVLKGEKSKLDTSDIVIDNDLLKEAESIPKPEEMLNQNTKSNDKGSLSFMDGEGLKSNYGFESQLFFPPLKGKISQGFSNKNHKAVDITPLISDQSVKATLDGTVIFTGWTYDFGHVIHLQHSNNLISVYKHNSFVYKEIGDYVRAGDVIAVAGNSGELTSGTHLHFELWFNGRPLDPTKFISF